jgi:type IV pilus assembly protein PilW
MTSLLYPSCRSRPRLPRQRASGFTLVELLVALALGLLLLGALVSLIVSSVTNRTELDKTSRQIENGRYALERLQSDIQMAGFKGTTGLQSWDKVNPVACPTSPADMGYSAVLAGSTNVPYPLRAQTSTPACLSTANVRTGTAMLLVSRAASDTVAPSAAVKDEAYIQVSTCGTDNLPFKAEVAGTDPASQFTLLQKDCVSTHPAELRKLVHRIYFISDCNDCGKDTLPTLKVAERIKGALVITPLVEGIEDLQFDYGIDMDENGSPDCYISSPDAPATTEVAVTVCPQTAPAYVWTDAAKNWTNVMAVRIHLLARNLDKSSDADSRKFLMGLAKSEVGPFNDGYKRHVFSTVARVVNDSALRELP